MAKFEIEFEVQEVRIAGLKIKVKGDREDARIAQALGQQLTGMLQPPVSNIIDVEPEQSRQPMLPGVESNIEPSKGKKNNVRRKRTANGTAHSAINGKEQAQALEWKHDPTKWGSPQQAWSTAQKALWILYVAGNETEAKELNSTKLAETFNRQFRQAGQIRSQNISRDFGKFKLQVPALVAEDTTQNPPAWFLTEAGIREAQSLVASARGTANSNNGE